MKLMNNEHKLILIHKLKIYIIYKKNKKICKKQLHSFLDFSSQPLVELNNYLFHYIVFLQEHHVEYGVLLH